MKILSKLLFFTLILFAMQACQHKPEYIAVRQQVLDQHDQLMNVGGTAMSLKMSLDSLDLKILKQSHPDLDTVAERGQIASISGSLNDADEKMSDWMHAFHADFKGKSDHETLEYFNGQKAKVATLDNIYKQRVAKARVYLKQFGLTMAEATGNHMKM